MADKESFVYVRNTVSGVTEALTVDDAAHILSHAWFSQFHTVVDSHKDEVLAQPYRVDEEGNREIIQDAAPVEPEGDN